MVWFSHTEGPLGTIVRRSRGAVVELVRDPGEAEELAEQLHRRLVGEVRVLRLDRAPDRELLLRIDPEALRLARDTGRGFAVVVLYA